MAVQIISRARWGARYERGFRSAPLPASEVWLHHSVTTAPDLVWVDTDKDGVEDDEERAMRTLEQIGEDRFGGGISYTFAVMPSGRVYEGHGVDRQGAHTGGRNDFARAIVLVGDYSSRAPTEAQKRSVAALLQHGKAAGWWLAARLNGGHRQAPGAQTACPGDAAFRSIPAINTLAAGGPIQEEDDMQPTDVAKDPGGGKWGWYWLNAQANAKAIRTYTEGTVIPQLAAIKAAIAADRDMAPEDFANMIDAAVQQHTPTAEQNVAALVPVLKPALLEVLQLDNEDQADAIVDSIVARLNNGGN